MNFFQANNTGSSDRTSNAGGLSEIGLLILSGQATREYHTVGIALLLDALKLDRAREQCAPSGRNDFSIRLADAFIYRRRNQQISDVETVARIRMGIANLNAGPAQETSRETSNPYFISFISSRGFHAVSAQAELLRLEWSEVNFEKGPLSKCTQG